MSISPQTCPIHNFNWESQDRFADFSGDRNPIHMDPIAARRTHAGQPVVHGMHAVLWALEALAHDGEFKRPPSMIKVRFQKLIFVGDTVTLRIVRSDAAGILLHLCVDELSVTSLNIAFGEPKFVEATEKPSNTIPRPEWPEEPIELSLNEIEKMTGWLAFAQSIDVAERVFPAISLAIGPRQVSALACMSRLVGMVCPGLHSTFFGLTIDAAESPEMPNAIHFRVTSVHDQFRLVKQSVEGGGWTGTLESIARFPQVAQESLNHLAELVRGDEFLGTHALIIGGSRGLGELTAKSIVAGGGSVTITYAVGRNDALEVQRQIREWGGRCEIMKYDATLPAVEQLAQIGPPLTSLYYFATTSIFLRKTRLYSREMFEKFYRLYVDGFYEACIASLRHSKRRLSVFYPSSVAVEDRPADMTEYAMAKAAGEILCTDLARSDKGLRLIVERLPRMLTDQTATVMPTKTIAPVEVLLPIVRRMEFREPS